MPRSAPKGWGALMRAIGRDFQAIRFVFAEFLNRLAGMTVGDLERGSRRVSREEGRKRHSGLTVKMVNQAHGRARKTRFAIPAETNTESLVDVQFALPHRYVRGLRHQIQLW